MKSQKPASNEVTDDLSTFQDIDEKKEDSRPKRQRRKNRRERGLPNDMILLELAKTYLETQRRLWPKLAEKGIIPEASEENLRQHAFYFRDVFLGEKAEIPEWESKLPQFENEGTSYLRYSDEGSNPRSLVQQLNLQMERAHRESCFIRWSHIFADAAVTGTTANRRGYDLAKQIIKNAGARVQFFFIDEIGRASRNAIESLMLGQLIEQNGKRLIGVSDGFDSGNPAAKLQLSMFAMLNEWFSDQLRSKVDRGMKDAFRNGTNIELPAIGYRLEPACDKAGNPIFGKEGIQKNCLVIDEEMAGYVRLVFDLFVNKRWSRSKIGRHFNDLKVDGKVTWDSSRILQLLTRWKYIGINVRGMKHQYLDPITGDAITEKKPRSEWQVKRARHLQIIHRKQWKAAQKLLEMSREAYSKKKEKSNNATRRTDLFPTLLFRPICGSCNAPLQLGRSGKYASFVCINGRDRKHGCQYRSYKSVRIVEEKILEFLEKEILTEDTLTSLVESANRYLKEESAKPKTDTIPFKKEIRKIKSIRDGLVDLLDKTGTDGLDAVVDKIRKLEKRIQELNRAVQVAESQQSIPTPLKRKDVLGYLEDLRLLLNRDVSEAAPILNQLTGPITVHQKIEKGRKKPVWFAHFEVNLIPVFLELSQKRDCPNTSVWEYLATRSWTNSESEGVWLGNIPTYERISADAIAMVDRGASVLSIASALDTSRETVNDALIFARTGERPGTKPTGTKTRKRSGPPKYISIREEVLRRHDVEKQSFNRIAQELGVCVDTVRRSWDSSHRQEVEAAAREGRTPDRGSYRHIASDKIK